MTTQMDLRDAESHFPDLLTRVRRDEEITLSDAGKPVVKLVPLNPTPQRRVLGTFKGRVHMANDFNAPLPEDVLEEFEK